MTRVVYISKCPECGHECHEGEIMHQHADGKWVTTQSVREHELRDKAVASKPPVDIEKLRQQIRDGYGGGEVCLMPARDLESILNELEALRAIKRRYVEKEKW